MTLVLAQGPDSYRSALAAAEGLRQKGLAVELDVSGGGLDQGLAYARKKDMFQVIEVQHDGRETSHPVGQVKR